MSLKLAPPYELQQVDGGLIVVMRFQGSDAMNAMLDPISNRVDGPIKNRMGHNFPRDEMTSGELQRVLPKHVQKPCRYVVACVKGNAQVSGCSYTGRNLVGIPVFPSSHHDDRVTYRRILGKNSEIMSLI